MGNRKQFLRVLSALLLSFVVGGGWVSSAATQAVPAYEGAHAVIVPASGDAARVAVTWTLRDEDLFACEPAAYDLRALVRTYGDAVSLRVIAVDSDPALVASFMRRERLEVAVVHLSTREYRQAHGTHPIPGVAVTRQGVLVESVNAGLVHVRGRRSSSSLDEIVRQALSPARYSFAH